MIGSEISAVTSYLMSRINGVALLVIVLITDHGGAPRMAPVIDDCGRPR